MEKVNSRILYYSHDTYGLGHLRRSLAISHKIANSLNNAHQLLVTGSMVAGAYDLPPRTDVIKLPALSKNSTGKYKSRILPLKVEETIAWRKKMIREAVKNFKPHLVLVDKSPAGVRGELLPALEYIKKKRPDTRLLLGMRDIDDAGDATQREWHYNGIYPLLDNDYDQIFLYGQRSFFNPVIEYRLSQTAADKVCECGYVWRKSKRLPRESIRKELGFDDRPFVLVTVGGGGDGYEIIQTYLQSLIWPEKRRNNTLIVTGPLMPEAKFRSLKSQAEAGQVPLIRFTPHLASYIGAADLVISMAGYNTVCEVLGSRRRSLLIPRNKVRQEQRIRAERLSEAGLANFIHPNTLNPDILQTMVQKILSMPPPKTKVQLNLNGLKNVKREIEGYFQ